ncbi:hypothetical protein Q9R46_23375 [Paenibacillus sp. RRE4]|uniref:hypothetical protein n=1 Tax=Paenibacillus TaxID=44249 RepID=UPI0011A2DFE7|nr:MULTISPECIES: hypothetical protein [Paenibacillus]MBR2564183.1 hypothetical protein [Paenibacillus sp.]MDT0125621.1 hypothetical protein [Paenibacillus sp. RRE4]CAI6085760.1 hypothetical protein PAECIP112173_04752 [Paenibacillus sp. JJ-100]
METLRYTYLYEVISTGETSEFSQMATSKEEAAALIVARIADLEFTEESDIKLGDLIAISKQVGDNYVACEGCAS